MSTHDLKIAPEYQQAVRYGRKRFEVRKDDRGFNVGDILNLRGWIDGEYTGSFECCEVIYILRDFEGLNDGFVVLGIERIYTGTEVPA